VGEGTRARLVRGSLPRAALRAARAKGETFYNTREDVDVFLKALHALPRR
jgi:selenocysteine lyase/cysteine desulfurase